MYKKAIGLLMLGNLIFLAGVLCVRGMEAIQAVAAVPAEELRIGLEELEARAEQREERDDFAASLDSLSTGHGVGIARVAVSGQRVVGYDLLEQPEPVYDLSDEDLEALLRIVEAEAGSEDEDGRLLVANVVLNRVASDAFPSTVSDVVFQQSDGVAQFSPVASGRYDTVEVSEKTVSAVSRALMGEDISQGALYFASRKHADSSKMRWFDTNLVFLFEHGGHEFFR